MLFHSYQKKQDTLLQNWNERVTSEDTVYVLGDAFWKNEENSIRIMERLQGHKHLIQGNHDRVKGKLRPYWESIEQYAEVNDENRLVILSHYPILFYKNQHYGAVMLYGHVHNTREWELVEKWKNEQWAMGIPSRLINVGCMMDYMRYTPRTPTELLDANPMPEIFRVRKDGSAVEVSKVDAKGWILRMKVTPLKKQSKKNQRKFHAAKRGSWNGVSPITLVVQSKRIYDRNRAKQESRQSADR